VHFLAAYEACGLIGKAAKDAGITRQAVLKWQRDQTFRQAMTRARQDGVNRLAAARADLLGVELQRFEEHIGTSSVPALRALATTREAATGRRRGRSGTPVSGLKQVHQQLRFLKAYAESGTVREACRVVDIERGTVSRWRQTDTVFASLFAQAQEEHREVIYGALFQHGVTGTLTPVWYRGKQIAHKRTYDAKALALLVRLRFPEGWLPIPPTTRPQPPAVTSPSQVFVPLDRLTEEELALLDKIYGPNGPPVVDLPRR
jgi:hypothetical protein